MQTALRLISDVMPLSYVVDAMQIVASKSSVAGTHFVRDVVVVAVFVVGSLILGALSIRRQTT
jgi:ABC-2 type transport system permease protein